MQIDLESTDRIYFTIHFPLAFLYFDPSHPLRYPFESHHSIFPFDFYFSLRVCSRPFAQTSPRGYPSYSLCPHTHRCNVSIGAFLRYLEKRSTTFWISTFIFFCALALTIVRRPSAPVSFFHEVLQADSQKSN